LLPFYRSQPFSLILAHRWEFFAAVKSEYSISRALFVEANPKLAESLKETFSKESDVLHAAVVGANNKGAVTFTQSTNPESSSIFRKWSAAYGIADQVDVPTSNSEVGETSGLGKVWYRRRGSRRSKRSAGI
jgi:hypothetical protein